MPRIVYRIVTNDPPTEDDLKTYVELGRELKSADPQRERMITGLSVYSTLAYARRVAKRFPWKGDCFIAEILLEDRPDIIVEQTGSNPQHFTLWCSQEEIRSSIVRIVRLKKEIGNV